MKLALKWFLPILAVAMSLAWISEQVALLLGFDPPPQDLVKLFTDPDVAWRTKAGYALVAVVIAPVAEELLFRMGLFNFTTWCIRRWSKVGKSAFPLGSAIISGAVFAAVHFHVPTFLPLWFLGVVFAWLYWKSGTVKSPLLCHLLFNLFNFAMCLLMARFGEI
ncbi:MAG: CPBP family intramembrane metalloprotease [Kiritimatiellae bacterium]|nr:CPBP family intramembrane metalloprotease [Kiritimatiellia bacterium]